MTREELIQWAEAHATGPMVSPVAVAVLDLEEELIQLRSLWKMAGNNSESPKSSETVATCSAS